MCAKGDKCAFLHVPQTAANSAPQPVQKVFTSSLQHNPQLKNSWRKPNFTAQQNTTSDKSKVCSRDGKPAQKQNLTTRVDHSTRIYQQHSNSYVQSGLAKHYQPQPSVEDDIAENGVEVGEFESFGAHVGKTNHDPELSFKGNHNSYNHPSREQHTGMRQTRVSQEPERPYKNSDDTLLSDNKRISQREPMNVTTGSLDLRHRLLKQRRLGNPRSTQAPDRHDEHHGWRGNEHAADEGLRRSRLHGRIKLPGETPFDRLGSRSGREEDRGLRVRLSPRKYEDLRGKLHERLKARSREDIPDNAKILVKKASITEDAGSLNFFGPKSLAELKAKKVFGSPEEDVVNNTASFVGLAHGTSETVASRDSSEPVPFEGPRPLSVILKRKREAASENVADSGSIHEDEEDPAGKVQALVSDPVEINMEANGEEEEYAFHPEDDMAYDNAVEDIDEDAGKELEESQDLEAEQDYDYDNADEDNDYKEYEDDDDLEDDDDFARKVGVIIS
jgi:hypothetical protein